MGFMQVGHDQQNQLSANPGCGSGWTSNFGL